MAEVILRQHKRRTDRWLPKEKQRYITSAQLMRIGRLAARSMPGYLLFFADVLGIPSGLHAAFCAALTMTGIDIRPTLCGSAVAMVVRWVSGVAPRWEMLLTLILLAFGPKILRGHRKAALLIFVGVSMLPTVIAGSLAATAAEMLRSWAALAITMLSAPVMVRAVQTLQGGRHITSLEECVSVGYLAAMCLCGGARMLFLGVNIGVLLASGAALFTSAVLGVRAGVMIGMLGGVVLSLQGIQVSISVALALGAFLAGVSQSMGKHRLTCGAFAIGAYLPMLLCGLTGFGCGASVLTASLCVGLLPRCGFEYVQRLLRRFLPNDPAPGDAYAAAALSAWEHTVAAMARAVPSPKDADTQRSGVWWETHLCQGCPEYELCGCMTTELGINKAEQVWSHRQAADEIWQDALDHLRGMGCQRLYFLRDAMSALRKEDEAACRVNQQAEAQREMLVTHLNAMSGAARRLVALTSGDSWWDHMAARRIRREIAERAMPVSLSFVRRVRGHAQAAFELHVLTNARGQAEDLCMLASVVLDVPMELASLDGDRILLSEQPLLTADVGFSSEPITGGQTCGDTAWHGMLQDGRCMVALSDGMGHGDKAALASRQTVELLRLCLDAGYTRQQTLTAVNGMLLLGGSGESFATADLLTIDLWNGHASLDKLGAASSWLYQQGGLSRLNSDAPPLGILDDIAGTGSHLRLSAGDALVLLSDGVEEAFHSVAALEEAIRVALGCELPADAAKMLLSAAFYADEEQRRDDQSVVVVYIRRLRNTKEALQSECERI